MKITRKELLAGALALVLLATNMHQAQAASNACYVTSRDNGQYVVQTAGKAGTISVYVNGSYATTVSKLNQLWYATKDKKAVVRGYDNKGLVCG